MLSRRESGLTYLMRPGSTFEKFLLAFLVVAVLYPLAYTVAFRSATCRAPGWARLHGTCWCAGGGQGGRGVSGEHEVRAVCPVPRARDLAETACCCAASLCRHWCWQALYFHRMAWLKTLVALFLLLFIAIRCSR